MNSLHQVWLKLTQWFLRRILNFVNAFLLFHYHLSLEKGRALHLNKLESPLPKDALCQVWLKLAQWFWRRRWKCEKFTTTSTTTMTNKGQILIRKAHLSLWLRWAKKHWFETKASLLCLYLVIPFLFTVNETCKSQNFDIELKKMEICKWIRICQVHF